MNNKSFYTNKINIILLATLCTLLWGSAYPSIKIGYSLLNISIDDIPSKMIFAGYRFILAGSLVLILTLFIHKNLSLFSLSVDKFKKITILGFTQTCLQYIFFYIGLSYTTGVTASILTSCNSFFSIILAHYFYTDDKLTLSKLLGCIIGFMGVVLVNMNGSALLNSGFSFKGEGLVILSCLVASAAFIYGKKIMQNNNAFIITGYQLLFGGISLTLIGFTLGGRVNSFSFPSVLILLYLALLSAIAFSLWSELLKYNKIGQVAIFNFLIPVFGTLLSAFFLKENIFDIKILLALILVSLGIYLVNKINYS